MSGYSKKAQDKVGKVMHEFKEGELKTSKGTLVKSRKQAVAIGLSEARKKELKFPQNIHKRSHTALLDCIPVRFITCGVRRVSGEVE